MEWKDVGAVVAKVAPVLGGALGGPVGAIAGAAGQLVASFLGVTADPAAVNTALADPETLVKMRVLEIQEQGQLLAWQAAQLDAERLNTQDARAMAVNMVAAGNPMGAICPALISVIVVVGFFWMLNRVLTAEAVNEPALLLLGSLGTAFGAVVNYYLGSSLGSFRKDALSARK